MANASHPDAELVARCLNGDDSAWRELVERYSSRIYRIAYHRTYDRAEAEELTQDCFLKVWENLDRYEPTEASLLAWIATLSRNLSIDHYRKRRREKGFKFVTDDALVTLLPGSDDPSADAVRRERLRFLLDALSQLPDELAEVVQMRDLDGLDYREIADLLGLPDGTVKSRLNRARVELARLVRERIGAAPLARGPLFNALTPQPGGGRVTAPAAPCRRAETALLAAGLPVPPEVASHAAFCESCGPLLLDCEENERLLSSLALPAPAASLAPSLAALSETEPPRVAVRGVLALLAPGALAAPEPSPALLRRLLALPAGHPRQSAPAAEASRFRRWRSDWRVMVALAYAACLALVAILGVDPLSAARSGASGMTAAGERALAEAKVVAGEKLDTVLASHRKRPLTEQLDYRLYRTLALGKAKTTAWAEILLGRVFGSRVEAQPSAPRPMREPDPSGLRSLDRAGQDAPLHRAQRA